MSINYNIILYFIHIKKIKYGFYKDKYLVLLLLENMFSENINIIFYEIFLFSIYKKKILE